VPQQAISGSFLSNFLFFIEKQGVKVIQKFISYLSRTHIDSSYLTPRAFFDPIATHIWTQKYPILNKAHQPHARQQNHASPERYTTDAP